MRIIQVLSLIQLLFPLLRAFGSFDLISKTLLNNNLHVHMEYYTCGSTQEAASIYTKLSTYFFVNIHRINENETNFTNLFGSDYDIEHNKFYILDVECKITPRILQSASRKKMFLPPFNWILLNFNQDLYNVLQTINFWTDSNVIAISSNLLHPEYMMESKIIKIYKVISENSTLIMEDINIKNTISLLQRDSIKRINTKGSLLSMAVVVTSNKTYGYLGDRR